MKEKLLNLLARLSFWLPSKVPSGMKEFQAFSNSIIKTYGLPDNDSFHWVVAYQLAHFDRSKDYKWLQLLLGNAYIAKRRIYLEIRGAESRQTAGSVFTMIKEKQQAELKAASEPKAAAVTTPALSVVPANGPETA